MNDYISKTTEPIEKIKADSESASFFTSDRVGFKFLGRFFNFNFFGNFVSLFDRVYSSPTVTALRKFAHSKFALFDTLAVRKTR